MLKFTPVECLKNEFVLNYSTCYTDVNERDAWNYAEPLIIDSVKTEEDLKSYLECFDIVKTEIDKSRTGYGYQGEYIDFEKYVEEGKYDKVEWRQGEGVSFIKDDKEHFIFVDDDDGMPTEDGHFLQGIKLEHISYFNEHGLEHYVTIED